MTQDEYAKIIAKNLKRIAYENDKTQADISRDLNINKQTVSSWFRGERIPRMGKIDLLCEYFHCKRSDIMEDIPPKKKNNIIRVYHQYAPQTSIDLKEKPSMYELFTGRDSIRISKKIPVLGRVAAGIPIEATEEIIDWEEISGEMALDGDYFCLVIKGNSMEPKFSNGDVVIVRQQQDADDGDIVIALINGSDAVCKRLRKYQDGIALVSTNPAYEPMYFSASDIEEVPVRIIGKVKELRAKF